MTTTKKGQFFLFPPPELNEYFILISPSDEIKKDIKKMKTKLYKIIEKASENQYPMAHILLFKTKWEKDIHVIQKLKKSLADQKSFEIGINEADAFSHGAKKKTLCLKIENPKPIQDLFEAVSKEFKVKNDLNPYLTIEQNILIADFEKIQQDLSTFNYQNKWTCDRVNILKKHKIKGTYKVLDEILFQ